MCALRASPSVSFASFLTYYRRAQPTRIVQVILIATGGLIGVAGGKAIYEGAMRAESSLFYAVAPVSMYGDSYY